MTHSPTHSSKGTSVPETNHVDDGNGAWLNSGPVAMPVWPTPGQSRRIIADTLPDPRPHFIPELGAFRQSFVFDGRAVEPAIELAAGTPSVGRIVHFHEDRHGPAAAIVTGAHIAATPTTGPQTELSLTVLSPRGMAIHSSVPHSLEPKPGHWSWPPRV